MHDFQQRSWDSQAAQSQLQPVHKPTTLNADKAPHHPQVALIPLKDSCTCSNYMAVCSDCGWHGPEQNEAEPSVWDAYCHQVDAQNGSSDR